jgi:hypothetical protein
VGTVRLVYFHVKVNTFDQIILKMCLAKGVAQAVDCLPYKHETLSSNPSIAGGEKKKLAFS